ncbi:hypothetical protein CEXT_168201 [Caerostris extrusa]|uniref:Uncharacterized protein n=1 Tax=Caerostris extrusa TaxID=172846 RepID=A0AAV4Q546_CAEEX|nr:hypothetical protein CEXT_168201 [Caerostris extrusa]
MRNTQNDSEFDAHCRRDGKLYSITNTRLPWAIDFQFPILAPEAKLVERESQGGILLKSIVLPGTFLEFHTVIRPDWSPAAKKERPFQSL